MRLLSLATLSSGATPRIPQTADILDKQDALLLRGDVVVHSQGKSEVGTIDTPEVRDASFQLEMSFPRRKPLVTDPTVFGYRLYRNILTARWSEAWHDDLACSKPGRRGLVPKTGTGSQLPTMTVGLGSEQMEHYIDEGLPVYSSCMVCSLYFM